jgi:hypothetical protein
MVDSAALVNQDTTRRKDSLVFMHDSPMFMLDSFMHDLSVDQGIPYSHLIKEENRSQGVASNNTVVIPREAERSILDR